MIKNALYILIASLLLTSCFKEDNPLPEFPMQTTTIPLGKYYKDQIFFNLAGNKQVKTVDKNTYDLGFQCGDSSWHIRLNTAAFMMAGNSGKTAFEQVTDTTGLDWRFDKSNGNIDSTAIGSWITINGNDTSYTNDVYVINRGYDHLGKVRGLQKMKFLHVDSTSYQIQYCDMNGDNLSSFTVQKKPSSEYSWFSFDDGGTAIDVEPLPSTWDLLFTQYTTLLYTNDGLPYPYLVTGVLSNYGKVEATMDSTMTYDNIDLNYARSKKYSFARDFIGYDWKAVQGDVNSGNVYYDIVEGRTYLIKTQEGVYFKLRFINFYSETGEKGYPTFQYDVL